MKNTDVNKMRKLYSEALNVRLGDSAVLRLQAVMDAELKLVSSAPPKPVMTVTEVADYLRVTPDVIENYLGDIPCFELGCKLLFRKDSVDEWIKEKERNYARDIHASNINMLKLTIA